MEEKNVEKPREEIKETDEGIRAYPKVMYTGGCKHYFEEAGMEDSGAMALKCKHCINGRLINPKTHEVKNGKIRKRDN